MRHAFRLIQFGEEHDLEERISFHLDLQDTSTFLLQHDLLTRGSLDWAYKLLKQGIR